EKKTNQFQRHRKQEQAHKGHQARERLLQLASLQKQGTALPQFRDDVLPGAPADKQGMDKRKEKMTKKD
ncbi:hypothetical protein, partial [Kandleria vitulina]|uniref:hypothetical protein n=1 Tax=Kandleria vitulina TaxID=1630 RepID=UPI001EE7227E